MSTTQTPNIDEARKLLDNADAVESTTIDWDSGDTEALFDVMTDDVDDLRAELADTRLEVTRTRYVFFGTQVTLRFGGE